MIVKHHLLGSQPGPGIFVCYTSYAFRSTQSRQEGQLLFAFGSMMVYLSRTGG